VEVQVRQGAELIASASGEIDYSNVAPFKAALEKAVEQSPKGFIIDLSAVTYMDSAGLQAIFAAYRVVIDNGGSLALVVSHPNIKEILSILGVPRFPAMYVFDSVQAAEQALAKYR